MIENVKEPDVRGVKPDYESPAIEVIEVEIERGWAGSDAGSYAGGKGNDYLFE